MSEAIPNPALYKRLSKPFRSVDAFNEAGALFFRIVAVAREACNLPNVALVLAGNVRGEGGKVEPKLQVMSWGDSRMVAPMLVAALNSRGMTVAGAWPEEHEAMLRDRDAKDETAPGDAVDGPEGPAAGGGE